MTDFRAALALCLVVLLSLVAQPLGAQPVRAQDARFGDANMAVALYADGAPVAGEEWMLALRFRPSAPEWHGYYANPGDAGQGMDLTLDLPDGWTMGEPIYPVPERLVIAGLMNHIYEGDYTVLVPVRVGSDAAALDAPLTGFVAYLACTDRICVPQDARLEATRGGDFDRWRAEVAPLLDREGGFEIVGETLRVAIPLPADLALSDPHIFVRQSDLGGGARVDYAAPQRFVRKGNLLVADIPLAGAAPEGSGLASLSGIIGFGDGEGLRFDAVPQSISIDGAMPLASEAELPSLWLLILASFAGGLLLNIMPCVFPILSLKALALAKAGGDERAARHDALAYMAGVVLACAVLGALVMTLRAAGQQVGWAFQLQELPISSACSNCPASPFRAGGRVRADPSPPASSPPLSRRRAPGRSWRSLLARLWCSLRWRAWRSSWRWASGWRCPSSQSVSCPGFDGCYRAPAPGSRGFAPGWPCPWG